MSRTNRKANVALWIAQAALAALFLFAGGYKLAVSMEPLARVTPFPPLFFKFIGLCEVIGALGLILPGIFRVRTGLTPLAAAGLTIIMTGAVIASVLTLGATSAIFPFAIGIVAAIVARGRRQHTSQFRAATMLPANIQAAGGR